MMKLTPTTTLALMFAIALTGCGSGPEPVDRTTGPDGPPAPPQVEETTSTGVFVPGLGGEVMVSGAPVSFGGIAGAVAMSAPDELRVYLAQSEQGSPVARAAGTAQVDGGSDAPLPLMRSVNNRYLFARLPETPSLPVNAVLSVAFDFGAPTSATVVLREVTPLDEDKAEAPKPAVQDTRMNREALQNLIPAMENAMADNEPLKLIPAVEQALVEARALQAGDDVKAGDLAGILESALEKGRNAVAAGNPDALPEVMDTCRTAISSYLRESAQ